MPDNYLWNESNDMKRINTYDFGVVKHYRDYIILLRQIGLLKFIKRVLNNKQNFLSDKKEASCHVGFSLLYAKKRKQ
jgi:hypothetical protein